MPIQIIILHPLVANKKLDNSEQAFQYRSYRQEQPVIPQLPGEREPL